MTVIGPEQTFGLAKLTSAFDPQQTSLDYQTALFVTLRQASRTVDTILKLFIAEAD